MLKPSLLEVFVSEEKMSKGLLTYRVKCFDKKDNKVKKLFSLIYLDNRAWKIIVGPPPGT